MKTSMTKMPTRSILMLGLLVTLGYSLSWNPDQFKVSRAELTTPVSFMDMASRDPALEGKADVAVAATAAPTKIDIRLGAFDLGQYEERFAKINVVVSRVNGTKVNYHIKDSPNCPLCYRELTELQLSKEAMESPEEFQRQIAIAAIDKFGSRLGSGPTADLDKPKLISKCYNVDEYPYNSDRLSCQTGEFNDLIAKCEEPEMEENDLEEDRLRAEPVSIRKGKSVSAPDCTKAAKAYFKKHLAKTLAKGLKQPIHSEGYQSAIDTRDELLETLGESRRYDSIKKDVAMQTADGVLQRASQTYATQLTAGQTTQQATVNAKMQIQQELNGSTGAGLCAAIMQENCKGANRMVLERNPNFSLYADNYEPILKSIVLNTDNTTTFDQLMANLAGTGYSSGEPVSNSIASARIANANARNSVDPISTAGQTFLSVPGQMPIAQGSVSIPSFGENTGSIQGSNFNLGQIQPGQSFTPMSFQYNSMAPVGTNSLIGQPGAVDANGFPMSPAQSQGIGAF